MEVKFAWQGSTNEERGLATYATKDSTFELWLPSFKKAQQLESVLRDVFAEGRRRGQQEMLRAATAAMNDVARSA